MSRSIALEDGPTSVRSLVPPGANPFVHRCFAVVICLAAAFVAWLGFFQPVRMDRSFTWADLPPLHAGFVGALYLFGAVLVGGSAIVRHRAQWGPAIGGIAIFTTSMLVLTSLNTEAFDWSLGAVKGWVISYVVYPPIAWALTVWLARAPITSAGGVRIGRGTTIGLQVTAAAFAAAGVALLVFRSAMADAWPWKVSHGVAQFYGGPFLAIAWVAAWYSRRSFRSDLAIFGPAMTALGAAVLVVSLDHRVLFDAARPATWLWFGGFGAVTAGYAWVTFGSLSAHVRGVGELHPGADTELHEHRRHV